MKRTYHCPHCRAQLNPNRKIILRAEVEGQRFLLLFSPTPGNYEVIIPDGVRVGEQQVVAFSCPVCGKDLSTARDPAMAEIAFKTAAGGSGRVIFAKQRGRHTTYFVTRERVASYGEHAEATEGVNYFGLGPED